MSTATSLLTAADLDFLGRPLHGFLSVAGGKQPPQPRPVWFEATAEGTIQFFTEPGSLKVGACAATPAPRSSSRHRWASASAGCPSSAAPR